MRWVGIGAALALLSTSQVAEASPEPRERLSEIEIPASEAWAAEGFRVQIKLGQESVAPIDDNAPAASGFGVAVEPSLRLTRLWSLGATLHYASLDGDLNAMRWSATADVTLHPFHGLFLGVGAGYAGLDGFRWDTGYEGVDECDGDGVMTHARTGWLFPLGELFATGPVVQLDLQWTRCPVPAVEPLPPLDEPPGDVVVEGAIAGGGAGGSTWWAHRSFQLAWSFAWR